MRVIDDYIRKSLIKIKISNLLDVEKKIGFENIGIGCLITPALFGNLIAVTQGEASFYFPTKIKEKHVLKISLLSIPKISGIVKFEDKPIHHFSISTLSEHNVSVEISPELVKDNLSKISISTNRHWSSKYLDKNLPDFPLGVAVRSIELASQF